MARFRYLIITNPMPGREDDFNRWYDEQHVSDVLKVPGFVAAQRFVVTGDSTLPGKYAVIYDVETDDPARTLADLNSRAGTPDMVLSDALDFTTVSATLLAPMAERIIASRK